MDAGAGELPPFVEDVAGVQLAASSRRRHRQRSCRVSAPGLDGQDHQGRPQGVLGELPDAATGRPSHRLRIYVHGNPSFARTAELRARVPVRDAFSPVFPVSDRPQRQRCEVEKADGPRPHVRSDGRRELHGLQLDVHVCRATADGGGQRTVGPSYRQRARRAGG